MIETMKVLVLLVVVVLVLAALHRLALWMEARGWIYYRRRRPSSSAVGNAFLEVQSLLEPGQRLVLEARRDDHAEQEDSGDPPDPVCGSGTHGRPV
jgi:hypothetical protein